MKSWDVKVPKNIKTNPALLGQANIPKPLHGINPRTIMGRAEWSKLRTNILKYTPYCKACGKVTSVLDLHEDYSIDYKNASMKIREYVPLCKNCHNFIHNGRLRSLVADKEVTPIDAMSILQHGFDICRKHDIPVFIGAYVLAKDLNMEPVVKYWAPPETRKRWEDWILVYKGKAYKGISYDQWMKKYG